MLNSKLAQKYAQAVYELAAAQGALDAVERQLDIVEDQINSHPDLAALIYHPRVPAVAKKETLRRIFASELTGFVNNFLLLLIDKRRETALSAIIAEYKNLANAARNIAQADVITALPLTESEKKALADKLSKISGQTVLIKTRLDPAILGGVIVKLGDKLIDGSVRRQIENLKEALIKSQVG